jgi:hypothetical protein
MRAIVLSLVLVCGTHLFAADAPDVTLRCMSPGEIANKGTNPSISVFGGQPAKFDADVTAPLGSHFGIYADLYQTSAGGWSVPLSKNLRLSPDLEFDARTQLIVPCTVPNLPVVRSPTRMLLKLFVRPQAQPDASRPMGTLDVIVYPPLAPADWKKTIATALEQAGLAHLDVFGKRDSLRRFFREQQIPFDDLGADWPDTFDSHTLYLGDSPLPKPDHLPSLAGMHLALFISSPSEIPTLPGVYSMTDATGGAVVKVTLPALLDHLGDDPRSQQVFLEIIGQTLMPQATPTDTNPILPRTP